MRQPIRFVTTSECLLCERGLTAVSRAAALFRMDVDVVDVGASADYAVYAERLPVVLSDGEVIAEGRIRSSSVLAALAKRRLLRS